jgi:hypothetical protein
MPRATSGKIASHVMMARTWTDGAPGTPGGAEERVLDWAAVAADAGLSVFSNMIPNCLVAIDGTTLAVLVEKCNCLVGNRLDLAHGLEH